MSEPQSSGRGRPRGSGAFSWRAFFQQSTTPIFVLGNRRRLRFANAAWEQLTGVKAAESLGMVCSRRRYSSPLAAALAPSPEAQAGKVDSVRRPAPHVRSGPPWWDVTFTPLNGDDGLLGIVGSITVVNEIVPTAARRVPASLTAVREKHAAYFTLDLFSGTAPPTERLQAQLRHAADSAVPLWLIGEPGSGKETAARVIHHAGRRRNAAFVGLDCTGLQPYLIESLLFGHGGVLGGEYVGTLYLKNPAALPRDLQQRLADIFTRNSPGTPRLISGSTLAAGLEAAAGMLVPDFHTALSVVEITVPPLRDRLADLSRFISRLVPGLNLEPATFDVLIAQPWPRNLRQLSDVLTDAATRAGTNPLKPEHLPRELRVIARGEPAALKARPISLDPLLDAIEAKLVGLALARTGGNAAAAAELLGIGRVRVLRRLKPKALRKPDDKP
jgi:DNA-binding NtrC family response regulator